MIGSRSVPGIVEPIDQPTAPGYTDTPRSGSRITHAQLGRNAGKGREVVVHVQDGQVMVDCRRSHQQIEHTRPADAENAQSARIERTRPTAKGLWAYLLTGTSHRDPLPIPNGAPDYEHRRAPQAG